MFVSFRGRADGQGRHAIFIKCAMGFRLGRGEISAKLRFPWYRRLHLSFSSSVVGIDCNLLGGSIVRVYVNC